VTDFPKKLRLKEMAEEDIYFAKRDRELIKALHARKLAKHLKLGAKKQKKRARALEHRYATATAEHGRAPWALGELYRDLIDKALKLLERRRR